MPLQDGISQAVVYGSHAAGTATAASDVDLLVVGDLDEMTLHKAIAGGSSASPHGELHLAHAPRVRAPPPRAGGIHRADPGRSDNPAPGQSR